jgi:hypothetical protein
MADSEAVATLRQTLQDHLTEIFGSYQVDKDGDFVVQHPGISAITFVRPMDWMDEQTIVRVFSITNVGMKVDEELSKFLATENAKLVFGAFFLDEDKPAVGYGHTLLGDFLQRKELEVALTAVVATAEKYDDEIKERFGGQLFMES